VTLSTADETVLADVAVRAARTAGAIVASSRPQSVEHKDGGHSHASQVVTEVDRRSQAVILEQLEPTRRRYGLGLLSEEQEDDGSRHACEHFWCIDPLDGTLPFIEGEPGYAVSVALVDRDGTPRIGAVFDPVEGRLLHAIRGRGAFVNGRRWSAPAPAAGLRLTLDRGFAQWRRRGEVVAAIESIAVELGSTPVTVVAGGGAVIAACRVFLSAPACFVKLPKPERGGGSAWDYAATACLVTEAGGVATDVHGAPLPLNDATSTFMNTRGVVIASDARIAAAVSAWASSAG